MESEIDRLRAITGSSLSRCRKPQFSLHFRGELAEFNVPGSGLPNPVTLKYKCKQNVRRKNAGGGKVTYTSTWKIRRPERRPNGQIAVPIMYEGDWSRAAVISLVFIIHSKKSQRISYSAGEILLIDDICEERCFVMSPRNERSSEDLKVPALINLLIDVWDVDAGNLRIRNARKSDADQVPRNLIKLESEKSRLMFQRIESTCTNTKECNWPESTDFLMELPLHSDDEAVPQKDSCGCNGSCKFDENANLVLPAGSGRPCVQFFCHQSILAQESKSFEEMFRNDWTKNANVLRMRNVSACALEMFLNFLYNGQLYPVDVLNHEDGDARVEFEEIVQVVELANRFEVDGLKSYCDSLLTDRYLNLSRAAEAILIAERYELPLLGQAALSLLSLSLDEEHLQALLNARVKHLLNAVIREARQKHLFYTITNPY